jgi:hypothetical protein
MWMGGRLVEVGRAIIAPVVASGTCELLCERRHPADSVEKLRELAVCIDVLARAERKGTSR